MTDPLFIGGEYSPNDLLDEVLTYQTCLPDSLVRAITSRGAYGD